MPEVTYREAVRDALTRALREDERVFLMGEDIGVYGGAFQVTGDLVQRFGTERVMDTPISELGAAGVAVGAALTGLRPILEFQFSDFSALAMEQIVNQAAKLRFMLGGAVSVPLVMRFPSGSGTGAAAQHSQSLEAWFAHVPGLQVVMPGSPADAKGLLLSSIMSDDPTLFIEGRSLFTMQEDVPDEPYFIRLGEALVRRPGRDVSLITMGSMVPVSLQAAEALSKADIDTEVVDLRCLMPLDVASIIRSVKKTGRLVVAEPGWRMYGAAAEIIATVVETLDEMRSRPRRVAWPQSAVPTSSRLEEQFYPTSDDIVAACRASVTES